MMLSLHPEDPCADCGSIWSPHTCAFDRGPTPRHARREPDLETRVRDSIADELRMRCEGLRHPNPCPFCDPVIAIARGSHDD